MKDLLHLLLFWTGTLVGIPLLVLLGRIYKPFLYAIFVCMLVATLNVSWSITFESNEAYKSATRGFEVHLVDLLAIVLAISMWLRPREYRLRWLFPILIPYLLFIFMGLFSWLFVEQIPSTGNVPQDMINKSLSFELRLYPLFEISKLLRGLFFFWVVINFVNDTRTFSMIFVSAAIVILYSTCIALINRYIFHEYRVTVGPFNYNDFNVYIGMWGVFIFPFALSTKRLSLSLFIWGLVLAALVAILLTISRSSLVGYVIGLAVATLLTVIRYPNVRNLTLIGVSAGCGFLLILKVLPLLLVRFSGTESDIAFRKQLDEMAFLMAKDHFFGVGLGNYAAMVWLKYANLTHAMANFIIGHNIWYLTLAEVGPIGLGLFVAIWLRYYQVLLFGYLRSFSSQNPLAFPALVGAFSATLPLQLQNMYHFSFRQTSVFYLFIFMMGVAVRMSLDLQEERRKLKRNAS